MAKLRFDIAKIKGLVDKLDDSALLHLVGDHGVYVMSFDQKGKRDVVYARGCDPNVNEGWYDLKRITFGGDDGADAIGEAGHIKEAMSKGAKYMEIDISPTHLKLILRS